MSKNPTSHIYLLPFLTLLIFWIGTGYLRSDVMFFAGLAVMGLSLVPRANETGSWRFGALALVFAGLALAVPTRSFHFLTLVCAAFWVVEQHWGRINLVPMFNAILLTAGAKTMSVVIGFPMRLQLSENAAAALRFLGSNATAEGNLIQFEGKNFLVDSACTGLQMVEVSFLFCFFLLGLFERRSGRFLNGFQALGFTLFTAILILIFNQLRIICLVIFNIPPENPMHEVVGIIGLGAYVFAPLWLGIRWFFRNEKAPLASPLPSQEISKKQAGLNLGFTLVLLGFLGYFAYHSSQTIPGQDASAQPLIPAGLPQNCQQKQLKDGITQFSNDSLLVYVKPIRGWYDTEHTPLICWQGSGYTFGQIQERKLGGASVYTGILEKKGAAKYYTAWWFDNGQTQTLSQSRWRWLDAQGAPGFSLVNVTASDPLSLENQLLKMLHGTL